MKNRSIGNVILLSDGFTNISIQMSKFYPGEIALFQMLIYYIRSRAEVSKK